MNKEWRPISHQQEKFLSLPDSINEAAFGGAAGPGKSECLLMLPIIREFVKEPDFKALFLRRTYKELELEIIPRSHKLYRPHGAKYSENCWKFPSGALIFFGHVEYEKDMYKYDSMEINLLLVDELQSFLELMYLYIAFSRVRSSNPKLPAIRRCSMMPGGIGHSWVNRRFVKPFPKGEKVIHGRGGNKRIFIFSTLQDVAQALPQYAKDYNQSLDALPEAEKKAKKGDWNAFEGQVFDEFRDKHYPDEPDNAIHLVPEFDIPSFWPRVCAIDWGYKAMTSVGFGAIAPSRRTYVYRHLPFFQKKISEWAPEVKYFIEKEQIVDIVICHSANQHRGQPHTILEQVETELNTSVGLGAKDRIGGKSLLHEYFRWNKKAIPFSEKPVFDNEHAMALLRSGNMQAYQKYLEIFQPELEETNLPKLQLFDNPGCQLISEAIKSCIYDKTNVEDVMEFPGDDPYDMLRMLIHLVDSFFADSECKQRELDKRAAIVNQLQQTGDMTAFYRNMRRSEAESNEFQAVSRYRKVGSYARNYKFP